MARGGIDVSVQEASVLVPPTGLPDAYADAVRVAETAPCRVVRLCPGAHGYPLVDWVLSPIPELCERHRLALLLDFDPEPVRWAEVVPFARQFPTVPMVVAGVDVADRAGPAALDAAANLVLELRRAGAEDLARFVDVFGTARFLCRPGEDVAASPELRAVLDGNAKALADGTYAEQHL